MSQEILRIRNLSSYDPRALSIRQGDKTLITLKLEADRITEEYIGQSGKLYLAKDGDRFFDADVQVQTNSTVSFRIDKVLPIGKYDLEVIVGKHKFPSSYYNFVVMVHQSAEYDVDKVIERYGKEDLIKEITPLVPQGPKGDKGDRGETGPQGIQGVKGDTGATGPQGPQGQKGADGQRGADGKQGPRGEAGKDSHTLTATVIQDCSFKNNIIAGEGKQILQVYYDGKQLGNDKYTCQKWYRKEFDEKWFKSSDERSFEQWGINFKRKENWVETWFRATYKGMTVDIVDRITNVNDGEKGDQGPRGYTGVQGPRGEAGRGIVNIRTGEELKYWCGTQSQYDAISHKDSNTIYDILE